MEELNNNNDNNQGSLSQPEDKSFLKTHLLKIIIIGSILFLSIAILSFFLWRNQSSTNQSSTSQNTSKKSNDGWRIENNQVYYYKTITNCSVSMHCDSELKKSLLADADVNSFEVLNNVYAKDNNNVYVRTDKIDNVDLSTFIILEGYYAKDKNKVYLAKPVLTGNMSANLVPGIIDGADPNTFQVLPFDYSKDKNNVYVFDRIVDGADVETFVSYSGVARKDPKIKEGEGRYNAEDKNYKYFHGNRVGVAKSNNTEFINDYFSKDSNNAFYNLEKIEGSDSSSFEIIEGGKWVNVYDKGKYAKDNNNYYFENRIVSGVDSDTFEILSTNYAKDKNYVYFGEKILENADPQTFRVECLIPSTTRIDGCEYAHDDNNLYYKGEVISGSNPKSFEIKRENANGINIDSRDFINLYNQGKIVEKRNLEDTNGYLNVSITLKDSAITQSTKYVYEYDEYGNYKKEIEEISGIGTQSAITEGINGNIYGANIYSNIPIDKLLDFTKKEWIKAIRDTSDFDMSNKLRQHKNAIEESRKALQTIGYLIVPEIGIKINFPEEYTITKNNEENRRGSFASYDFNYKQLPSLNEIQFFSEESIQKFTADCGIDTPCFFSDYPDLTRYNGQKNAFLNNQNFLDYKLEKFNDRNFFISTFNCHGDSCQIKEYTTFIDDIKIDFWITMENENQTSQADELFKKLEINLL
ncbi:MAG: DKNYY domain-containing protein [Patescibacteria group bacterium]|nr:DKNYY domain-containing protein [Patescibacteria group bacterium]